MTRCDQSLCTGVLWRGKEYTRCCVAYLLPTCPPTYGAIALVSATLLLLMRFSHRYDGIIYWYVFYRNCIRYLTYRTAIPNIHERPSPPAISFSFAVDLDSVPTGRSGQGIQHQDLI